MTPETRLTPQWQDISTAPENGEFLTFWPGFKLGADGNLTRIRKGKPFIGVAQRTHGVWDEPEALNAIGDYFGDDWEYGEPTHWMPLPTPPKDISAKIRREAARDMKADMYGENSNG